MADGTLLNKVEELARKNDARLTELADRFKSMNEQLERRRVAQSSFEERMERRFEELLKLINDRTGDGNDEPKQQPPFTEDGETIEGRSTVRSNVSQSNPQEELNYHEENVIEGAIEEDVVHVNKEDVKSLEDFNGKETAVDSNKPLNSSYQGEIQVIDVVIPFVKASRVEQQQESDQTFIPFFRLQEQRILESQLLTSLHSGNDLHPIKQLFVEKIKPNTSLFVFDPGGSKVTVEHQSLRTRMSMGGVLL